MKLSTIPQLAHLFKEADSSLAHMEQFVGEVERRLADCLRTEKLPPLELVEAIAAAKVKAVELAIDLCWRLKQEVGSYALMTGCGFEQMDYLQCCKFAEGDSRILMQKMTRDRVKAFQKGFQGPEEEARLCKAIVASDPADEAARHYQVY